MATHINGGGFCKPSLISLTLYQIIYFFFPLCNLQGFGRESIINSYFEVNYSTPPNPFEIHHNDRQSIKDTAQPKIKKTSPKTRNGIKIQLNK